jgi:tetratricopeptide (TPR) repeat protein
MKEILRDTLAAAVAYGDCFDLVSASRAPGSQLDFRTMCGKFLPVESIDPRFSKGRLLFDLADRESADSAKRLAFYKDAGRALEDALTRFRDPAARQEAVTALSKATWGPSDRCVLELRRLLGNAGWRRGVCQRETGDLPGCLAALSEAVEIDNGNDRILSELARSLIEKGTEEDLREARRKAQGAVDINTNEPQNHMHLAWAYYRMKMFQDAIVEGNQAISLDKTNAFPLARVIAVNAHIEQAAELMRAYEKMDPTMETISRYKDLGPIEFLKDIEQLPKRRDSGPAGPAR